MKVLLAMTALGLCVIAPGISACEYDATSASATPPAQLGLAPAPAASRAPVANVVKANVQKAAARQPSTKGKPVNEKVAAASPQ